MILPSLQNHWENGKLLKPRIRIVEIRDKRKIDAPPLAWLLLEREEIRRIDDRDGSVWDASVRLSYRRIGPKYLYPEGKGSFEGGYSSGFGYKETVSLTSTSGSPGAIFLDLSGLEGQRIGTYMLNEIIEWAQQWPHASVNRISLNSLQADSSNKERRNKFYERFNIKFKYMDSQ
jgi:GNAT superfamily N-acetyltransferase